MLTFAPLMISLQQQLNSALIAGNHHRPHRKRGVVQESVEARITGAERDELAAEPNDVSAYRKCN